MQPGTCKHFSGTHMTDPQDNVGKALRKPCHSKPYPHSTPSQLSHFRRRGSCDKYEEPTAQDLAEHKARCDEMFTRIAKTIPLVNRIKQQHKGKDLEGIEVCPVCGGNLHIMHAACNGHVWGKCETDNCVSWME